MSKDDRIVNQESGVKVLAGDPRRNIGQRLNTEQPGTEPAAVLQGDQRGKFLSDWKELIKAAQVLADPGTPGIILLASLIPEQIDKNIVRFKVVNSDGFKPHESYLTFNRKILPVDFDRTKPGLIFKVAIIMETAEYLKTDAEIAQDKKDAADAERALQHKEAIGKEQADLLEAAKIRGPVEPVVPDTKYPQGNFPSTPYAGDVSADKLAPAAPPKTPYPNED